jgi:hypothetical protein
MLSSSMPPHLPRPLLQEYSERWLKVNKIPIASTTLTIRDLVESSEYDFRVVAENAAGVGRPSEASGRVVAQDPYSKPDAPTAPTLEEITAEAATLTWTKPKSDGNSPITNYLVEMRAAGDFTWMTVNATERCLQTKYMVRGGLKEGVTYEFRVIAENKVGQSPPSEAISGKYGKFDNRQC